MTAIALASALLVVAGAGPAAPTHGAPGPGPCAAAASWPHWSRYTQAFVAGDGRVIDHTDHDRTTSEGQAYALFFALVADDQPLFRRILRWTEDNLAGGDLARTLPAWLWGKRGDGSWGVIDRNAASDADLWAAYALLEAGRLWAEPRFDAAGKALLSNMATREVAEVPGLGPTLLPGPSGFVVGGGGSWRLNPSYLPPQVLERVTAAAPDGPWSGVLSSARRILRESAPAGVVPDWILYAQRGFRPDPVKGRTGSYDAIRAYLWLGMAGGADARTLQDAATGLLRVLSERGSLPERIDSQSLRGEGQAPVGFYAALAPLARATGSDASARLQDRVAAAARDGLYGAPPTYYDQNLVLFAMGFLEGRYRFGADGQLLPRWGGACAASSR